MEDHDRNDGWRAGGVTWVIAAVVAVGLAFAGAFAAFTIYAGRASHTAILAASAPTSPQAPVDDGVPTTTAPSAPAPSIASRARSAPAAVSPAAPAAPTVPAGPTRAAAAAVLTPSTAGPYAFVQPDRGDGTPARWDPCTPIHAVVNATASAAPAAAVALVGQALDQYSRVTGLRFVVDGGTTLLPGDAWGTHAAGDASATAYPHGWAPVLIAWTIRGDADQLSGGNSGFGGPVMWHDRKGPIAFVSGSVAIDATATAGLPLTFGPSTMGALLLHELGHVVGLAHVNDAGQIMNHFVSVGAFGTGDLAGLALLGKQQVCFTPPRAPW